jgi:hypothetical protein
MKDMTGSIATDAIVEGADQHMKGLQAQDPVFTGSRARQWAAAASRAARLSPEKLDMHPYHGRHWAVGSPGLPGEADCRRRLRSGKA